MTQHFDATGSVRSCLGEHDRIVRPTPQADPRARSAPVAANHSLSVLKDGCGQGIALCLQTR